MPIHIQIDASAAAGKTIPRTIFGTFLEPIGNSTYNGLWAETLENPSFEENLWNAERISGMIKERPQLTRASGLGLPLPWEPLDYKQVARYEPRWNDAANSFRSLFLAGLPEREVGIRQRVYLPVHRTLQYTGSLYVKTQSARSVEVSLRVRDDAARVLARQQIAVSSADWKKYPFHLNLATGTVQPLEPVDFVVSIADGGRALLDQVSLIPADNISGMDPDMLALSKAMHTPLVRFGGNFTSAYHWRDGIGPRDKRVSMLNIAWGMPEYNQFGTDEFLEFCRLIGAEPQIALNLGTGTPEEAADWVRYVDGQWNHNAGGLLWELGNELWGTFQTAYPAQSELAGRTLAFSNAVKAVDRSARLIATGADPDHFADWNGTQMSVPAGTFDYLSTHFVVRDSSVTKKDATSEDAALAAFALPIGLERKLKEMHAQFDADPKWHGKLNTAFTEWLFWSRTNDYPYFKNMGGAVVAGGFLNMLLRNADIVPISDMTGIVEFAGIWKQRGRVFAVPSYYAFSLFSNADIDHVVRSQTDGESYEVEQGIDRLPQIKAVPFLDVVATLNKAGNKLSLFCVNRSVSNDLRAQITLSSFHPRAGATHGRALFADSIYEGNDETTPDQVEPRMQPVETNGDQATTVFRHESVTVLEFVRE